MSETITSFIGSMRALSPRLNKILDEHLKDNFGELLPHVLLGEITRYIVYLCAAQSSQEKKELDVILECLENGYIEGNEELRELIVVSFLENLPQLDEKGAHIREMIGPNLKKQLDEQ